MYKLSEDEQIMHEKNTKLQATENIHGIMGVLIKNKPLPRHHHHTKHATESLLEA